MEKRDTFNTLFYIRRNRLNSKGEAPVFLRITVNGKSTALAIHRKIDPKQWISDLGQAKSTTKELKRLNEYIFSVRSSVYEQYKYLRESNKDVDAENIKKLYLGKEIEEKRGILALFREHNAEIKKLEGIDYSKITIRRYNTSYNRLEAYIKEKFKKDEYNIVDINHSFVIGYENFLKTSYLSSQGKPITHNTTVKFMKQLKKIVRIANANGWLTTDPFAKIKIREKKVDRGFLTEEELNKLINLDLKIARLSEVRDCFVFSCFTGLAHSDLARLTKKNIVTGTDGNKWIKINRKKTDSLSTIPVLEVSQELIDKYKNHVYCVVKNSLLPVKSNQKMNAYLKEIGRIAGIDKDLTTHLARHTFATTVTLNNDVPIESVSKMLGHSSITTTKIYARLLDKKVGLDMQKINGIYSL